MISICRIPTARPTEFFAVHIFFYKNKISNIMSMNDKMIKLFFTKESVNTEKSMHWHCNQCELQFGTTYKTTCFPEIEMFTGDQILIYFY